jgi:hypothetical protein
MESSPINLRYLLYSISLLNNSNCVFKTMDVLLLLTGLSSHPKKIMDKMPSNVVFLNDFIRFNLVNKKIRSA